MYLTPADYEFQLRDDIKEIIADGSVTMLTRAESAAYKFMRGHLKKRYDVDTIFLAVRKYDPTQAYLAGQLIYWQAEEHGLDRDYKVFQALQDNTGQTPDPDADTVDWSTTDPRDQLILMYLVDITVYHFFSKEATHVIPEHVRERFKAAKEWVTEAGAGDIEADLPAKVEADPDNPISGDIKWNSKTKECNTW